MKRCPTCQSVYTDDSLSYCLQDGSKLAVVRDSSSEETWQMTGSEARTSGAEPPPTEILRPEDMPTARVEGPVPTREQQRARPTAVTKEPTPVSSSTAAAPPPRSNSAVVALSVIVALLLVTLGGLITWVMMRDRGRTTETQSVTTNSNQAGTRQENTQPPRSNTNAAANTAATPQPSPVDVAAARAEVQAALNGWAETVRRSNLEEHMKYYADTLDVYYNATNVSRSRVRDDREAAFSKYSSMDMQVANINIEIDQTGTRAIATFDKTFDFRNEEKSFNGSGLNRFWFTKTGGRWRITGEKELKNYYVNR
ncbi:MAG TPA: nuclear transport factor 2 family protein [Pyrinomonadaceae bacterium]|nr:nuclear transport factor 2 family protein [Pyrinomonadaceae bacterium]